MSLMVAVRALLMATAFMTGAALTDCLQHHDWLIGTLFLFGASVFSTLAIYGLK